MGSIKLKSFGPRLYTNKKLGSALIYIYFFFKGFLISDYLVVYIQGPAIILAGIIEGFLHIAVFASDKIKFQLSSVYVSPDEFRLEQSHCFFIFFCSI